MSVSENWYVVRDQGTNYCNLYNLMEGETTDKLTERKQTPPDQQ